MGEFTGPTPELAKSAGAMLVLPFNAPDAIYQRPGNAKASGLQDPVVVTKDGRNIQVVYGLMDIGSDIYPLTMEISELGSMTITFPDTTVQEDIELSPDTFILGTARTIAGDQEVVVIKTAEGYFIANPHDQSFKNLSSWEFGEEYGVSPNKWFNLTTGLDVPSDDQTGYIQVVGDLHLDGGAYVGGPITAGGYVNLGRPGAGDRAEDRQDEVVFQGGRIQIVRTPGVKRSSFNMSGDFRGAKMTINGRRVGAGELSAGNFGVKIDGESVTEANEREIGFDYLANVMPWYAQAGDTLLVAVPHTEGFQLSYKDDSTGIAEVSGLELILIKAGIPATSYFVGEDGTFIEVKTEGFREPVVEQFDMLDVEGKEYASIRGVKVVEQSDKFKLYVRGIEGSNAGNTLTIDLARDRLIWIEDPKPK